MNGAQESNETNKPLLVFLHVPKTGGTTLNHILSQQCKNHVLYDVVTYGVFPEGVTHISQELADADSVSGHFLYGVHRYVSRPCIYLTLLRDPVEQVISWFYFRYKNPLYDQFDGTLLDYLNNAAYDGENTCIQTRFLSGNYGAPNLENAKYNLRYNFEIFGILESFEQSVALMVKQFQWGTVDITKWNATSERPCREHLSKETIAKIEANYAMDFELYQFATQLFRERVRSLC